MGQIGRYWEERGPTNFLRKVLLVVEDGLGPRHERLDVGGRGEVRGLLAVCQLCNQVPYAELTNARHLPSSIRIWRELHATLHGGQLTLDRHS